MNLGGIVKRSLATILVLALAIILAGKTGIGATPETSTIQFRDVTQLAGIRFVHNNGAFGKKFLPETMGPGVAFIDYDNDGWTDIFLVNGMDWPGHAQKHSTPKLYHNNHDGTFTDVTHKAGLDVESGLMGYVGEGAVMVVVIELGRGVLLGVAGPVHAVYKKNVRPAVIVVVNEGDAGSHSFRQEFLAERAIVVDEADSGKLRDVAELNRGGFRRRSDSCFSGENYGQGKD